VGGGVLAGGEKLLLGGGEFEFEAVDVVLQGVELGGDPLQLVGAVGEVEGELGDLPLQLLVGVLAVAVAAWGRRYLFLLSLRRSISDFSSPFCPLSLVSCF
jgi:hypothetical protein